ncbi:MAG: UpxY family transcription antiterminator [Nitrospira sp.]|nr:UpxY family transcription antiterminator [Nitrospira sp.]
MRAAGHEQHDAGQQEERLPETASRWYALQTYFHHEKQVRDRLVACGIEPFLPLCKQRRQWSDRTVWTAEPLFRGYCFARFALEQSLDVRKTSGVVRIVGALKPEPIREEEIAVFRQVCASDRSIDPCDYFVEGRWVEVVRGPLAGLRGQFISQTKHHGVVIRASFIQQAALIHIGADEVAPAQNPDDPEPIGLVTHSMDGVDV